MQINVSKWLGGHKAFATAQPASAKVRLISWMVVAYMLPVSIAIPYFNWESVNDQGFTPDVSSQALPPTTKALVWPYILWEKLSATAPEVVFYSREAAELKKFDMVWYYIAIMNLSLEKHNVRYVDTPTFLSACHNFGDYIRALHRTLYAARSIDTIALNGIYPELGSMFKLYWVRGADSMMDACVTGSEQKFIKSRKFSGVWDAWYESHSREIEAALKALPSS